MDGEAAVRKESPLSGVAVPTLFQTVNGQAQDPRLRPVHAGGNMAWRVHQERT